MRITLYIISILLIAGCITSQKARIIEVKQSATPLYYKKPPISLGETTFNRNQQVCQYVVEDISTYLKLPDSLKNKTISQSPKIGDTIISDFSTEFFLYFEDSTAIDTFSYYVRLSCDISTIQQVIYGCGTQDTWELPELAGYPNNTVKVFNRWGTMVFEEKGYYTGWNGTTNITDSTTNLMDNRMLPEGTYYYIIELGDTINEPYVGYLQIKR